MKPFIILALASCMTFAAICANAETLDIPGTPNDGSSYPESNQMGAAPNIPDPVHGTQGESYRAPDSNMPSLNKTTVYNPNLPVRPGNTTPTVPENSDVIDNTNSGILIPDGRR
jgi:hypothetical protein